MILKMSQDNNQNGVRKYSKLLPLTWMSVEWFTAGSHHRHPHAGGSAGPVAGAHPRESGAQHRGPRGAGRRGRGRRTKRGVLKRFLSYFQVINMILKLLLIFYNANTERL